jgi:uncharacterized protein YydD (DUF2326 family)
MPIPFHTLHTVETIAALVGASLLIKGIEKCSEKYCANTEINEVVQDIGHEVEGDIKHDIDQVKEFHNDEHNKHIHLKHEYVHLQ